mmetsp:Transcript_8760/g.22557  ORF Transcript_8760/g.22557 Transcript_8760/m.22557 type:complete len:209 (-) Transcript_8760:204-830(-)
MGASGGPRASTAGKSPRATSFFSLLGCGLPSQSGVPSTGRHSASGCRCSKGIGRFGSSRSGLSSPLGESTVSGLSSGLPRGESTISGLSSFCLPSLRPSSLLSRRCRRSSLFPFLDESAAAESSTASSWRRWFFSRCQQTASGSRHVQNASPPQMMATWSVSDQVALQVPNSVGAMAHMAVVLPGISGLPKGSCVGTVSTASHLISSR